MYRLIVLSLFLPLGSFCQNQIPQISNLNATLDLDNATITITYDLEDAENDAIEISLEVAEGDIPAYLIDTENAAGDVGFPVSPGTNKSISWQYGGLVQNPGDYKIRLVADDRVEINIQEIVDQVDSNRLRSDLEFICGIRHRTTGLAHLEEVKDTIIEIFEAENLTSQVQTFPIGPYEAANIIGLKTGTTLSENTYIVDAHFDTVDDAPGADDNGSGVAGFLEAARVLSNYNFKKSIKFVGFDLEESGLIGSNIFVNSGGIPDYETLEGVFNFEMIGYFDTMPNTQTLPAGFDIFFPEAYAAVEAEEFRGNFITNVGVTSFADLNMAFDEAASLYVPELRYITVIAPDALVPPDLARSDHARFWEAGLPALMLTDGANFRNIHYHTPEDDFSTINFNFMTNVVKATIGAIANLAEVQHSSIAETDINIPTATFDVLNCAFQIFQSDKNQLLLNFKNCEQAPERIELYSINGQLMQSHEIRFINTNSIELNIGSLPAGLYLIRLSDRQYNITEKIFIP